MSRKKKKQPARSQAEDKKPMGDTSAAPTTQSVDAQRKDFPFEDAVKEPLRIAVAGEAYAEVVSHGKESLDEEICGVLVGKIFQDQDGLWVAADAAIRGTSARQGGKHVTYTQETWEKIYEIKDRDHPSLNIVGWYHTHPGFGVEFSDMDRFIQQNFFSGAGQFALVSDPLSGDEAMCANMPNGLRDVGQFWVDGRPRKCWTPKRTAQSEGAGSDVAVSGEVERRLESVEQRLGQMIQLSDEDRARHYRILMTVGLLFGFACVLWICSSIYRGMVGPFSEPPRMRSWVPVPVEIDGETVMLGVGIHRWDVPPELNAALVELERQRQAMENTNDKTPETNEEDEKEATAWTTALPMIILFAFTVAALAFVVGSSVLRGIKRGARQRK